MTADYSLRTTASFVAADGTTLAVGAEVGADSYRLLAWNGRRWKALGEVGVPVVALWAFSAKDVWLGGPIRERGTRSHFAGTERTPR